ncbi:hypothetical protein V6N11_036625 [Hibiscus sabdariffa]|uniref:Uncharacterized protein n=1 Tax=Hibiscus sabdariffa TaxID=183260 RepID=A0ABR2RAX1_9ROSI
MDQILNKVGSYWLGQKANKEINSVGDDLNSLSTSIEGGAKWLVNKIKGKMQKPQGEFSRGVREKRSVDFPCAQWTFR